MGGVFLKIAYDSLKPIYVQIAEAIEDDVLSGELLEGEPSYSQLVIAKELKVNPATAAKGINLLVSEGILQKQRGLSMIVAPGAREIILEKRRSSKLVKMLQDFLVEAKKLNVSKSEIQKLIDQHFQE